MLYSFYRKIVSGNATYSDFKAFMLLLDLHSIDNDHLIDICKDRWNKERKQRGRGS